MIALVWRYEVEEARRAEFEAAFGPAGEWAQLFARSEGFRGEELFRSEDGSYLALIAWRSREDLDAAGEARERICRPSCPHRGAAPLRAPHG